MHETNVVWNRGNVVVAQVENLEFSEMKDLCIVRRLMQLSLLQASSYRFRESIKLVVPKVQI
jgi:hypothetical protein